MAQRSTFPLPNTQKPVSGPVGVNVSLDFTGGDNISGDLALEQSQGAIEYVQAIYIDNSANTKSLSITFAGLGYNITVKAGVQGTFPILCQQGPVRWTAKSVGAGVVVPVIMTNVQQPYSSWQAV